MVEPVRNFWLHDSTFLDWSGCGERQMIENLCASCCLWEEERCLVVHSAAGGPYGSSDPARPPSAVCRPFPVPPCGRWRGGSVSSFKTPKGNFSCTGCVLLFSPHRRAFPRHVCQTSVSARCLSFFLSTVSLYHLILRISLFLILIILLLFLLLS